MRIFELLNEETTKVVYHSSPRKHTKFNASGPVWFSLTKKDARAWHENGKQNHGEQFTHVCEYVGGKIATINQAAHLAKRVWPDDDFLYSMLDAGIGEYDSKDVKTFISLLQAEGFDATYIDDYDPENFHTGSTRSLCVFRPDQHIKILRSTDFEGNPIKSVSEVELGNTVSFTNDSTKRVSGTVVAMVKQNEPIPNVKGFDFTREHADSQAGRPAYKDSLFIKDDNGRIHFVMLFSHQTVKVIDTL